MYILVLFAVITPKYVLSLGDAHYVNKTFAFLVSIVIAKASYNQRCRQGKWS